MLPLGDPEPEAEGPGADGPLSRWVINGAAQPLMRGHFFLVAVPVFLEGAAIPGL